MPTENVYSSIYSTSIKVVFQTTSFKAFPFHDLAHESKFSEDVLGRAGNLSYFSASEQIYLSKSLDVCIYVILIQWAFFTKTRMTLTHSAWWRESCIVSSKCTLSHTSCVMVTFRGSLQGKFQPGSKSFQPCFVLILYGEKVFWLPQEKVFNSTSSCCWTLSALKSLFENSIFAL